LASINIDIKENWQEAAAEAILFYQQR
jgi:hypothetical protein